MSTSSIKRQTRRLHVVVVQWTSKKCTKKRDARAELLFWSLNLLFSWSRRRGCLNSQCFGLQYTFFRLVRRLMASSQELGYRDQFLEISPWFIWEISARFPRCPVWEKAERGFLARNARKKANVAKHKSHNFRVCQHNFRASHSCITAVKWDAYDVENTAGNARRCNPVKKFVKISSRDWLLTLFSLTGAPVRAISCGTRASMQSGTWANFNKPFTGI